MAHPKSLKETAKSNPTMLGDPVSLKAETSNTSPTENDRPHQAAGGSQSNSARKSNPAQEVKQLAPTEHDIGKDTDNASQPSDKHNKSLKELAEKDLNSTKNGNPTMLGDPISLKAETSTRDPVADEASRGEPTSAAPSGKGRPSKL